MAELFPVTFKTKQKRWRFPKHRFCEFSREDEERALQMGWSVWGGEPYEEVSTFHFPNVFIESVNPDGSLKLKSVGSFTEVV